MLVVSDIRMPQQAEQALLQMGHRLLPLPPHPHLPAPVASHPDMLLCFMPDGIYTTKTYLCVAERALVTLSEIAKRPLIPIEEACGACYPEDVPLNAFFLGKHLFCNPKTVSKSISACAHTPLWVRQGYTKCATVPVGSDALMTDDPTVARAAESVGMDTLLLPKGEVRLPGYAYGFFGGCTSYAPFGGCKDIFVCGDLSRLSFAEEALAFCNAHGHRLLSLGDFSPLDVGTLFLI